jgi:hypothetical protein
MIEREEYLKAKSIVDAFEKQNIDKDILEEFKYFKKGCSNFCSNCGSTESRDVFLAYSVK